MPDAFRFKGAAPEIINCRLAMLGAFAGLTAELATGRSIIEQYRMGAHQTPCNDVAPCNASRLPAQLAATPLASVTT